jgi:hypothetical protein
VFFPNTTVHENIYMPYLYIYIHNIQTTMVKISARCAAIHNYIFFINIHTQKQKHKQHVNVKIDTAEKHHSFTKTSVDDRTCFQVIAIAHIIFCFISDNCCRP